MLRALYIFLIVAGLSAVAIWLADNPGSLVMHWRGYEIRTSFVVGLALLVGLAMLVLYIYRAGVAFFYTPATVSAFLDTRRQRKGFAALSRGMVAVAAGDALEAKRYAAQAHRLLDALPLTLLLAAQAAQLEGNEEEASKHFSAMLKTPETEFLGLRGLFIQARRAGERDRALAFARRAWETRPRTGWAAQAVFEIETSEENWEAALATLERAQGAKLLTREEARRRRAVLLTAEAMRAEQSAQSQASESSENAKERALSFALQAVSLMRDFVPAVALAAQLCADTNRQRRASRLLEDAWTRTPHPALADIYLRLAEGESAYDRFSRMRLLAGHNRDHPESRIALARAAIGARDWLSARGALQPLVDGDMQPGATQRVCELMAEIEEGEFGNMGRAREWLARALYAPEDEQWVGENYRSDKWSPLNPATGEFDALEWKVPLVVLSRGIQKPLPVLPREFSSYDSPLNAPAQDGAENSDEEADLDFPPLLPDDPGTDGGEAELGEERKW
jgi:HemY protein